MCVSLPLSLSLFFFFCCSRDFKTPLDLIVCSSFYVFQKAGIARIALRSSHVSGCYDLGAGAGFVASGSEDGVARASGPLVTGCPNRDSESVRFLLAIPGILVASDRS